MLFAHSGRSVAEENFRDLGDAILHVVKESQGLIPEKLEPLFKEAQASF